jgi:hypothetical protein
VGSVMCLRERHEGIRGGARDALAP